uniref:CCT domain-containing protein n=1 Tax=viral metagenome TaxID=1070528 RepID=A0A6C0BPC7_9ZZZZ
MEDWEVPLIQYQITLICPDLEPCKTVCYPIDFTNPYIHEMVIGALPLGQPPPPLLAPPKYKRTQHVEHAIQTYRNKRSRRRYRVEPLYPSRSKFASSRPRKHGRFIKMSAECS